MFWGLIFDFHMGGDERDLAPCAFRLPRIWSQQKQQQWDSTALGLNCPSPFAPPPSSLSQG